MPGNIKYVPISVDVLAVGMKIDYSIYYKFGKEFVLLCKDIVITEDVIKRLKNMTTYNIYVPKNLKHQILEESTLMRGLQNEVEELVGYGEVIEATDAMLDIISESNKVPVEVTNVIADELNSKLETVDNSLLIQCINGIRKADEYLYHHSMNVALLNGLMGKWLEFDEKKIEKLVKIGLLHDIGKLRISEDILQKPTSLTEEEFSKMKEHPSNAGEILINSGITDPEILDGVIQHHEKVNGNGYPKGLDTNTISEYARITAVSDVYDAMVAKRVYKEAHSPFEILSWFSEGRYSELDINFIDVFLQRMPGELMGKLVMMSDGSIGKVNYINPRDYEYPIVEIDGKIIKTNKNLYCISMYMGKKEIVNEEQNEQISR